MTNNPDLSVGYTDEEIVLVLHAADRDKAVMSMTPDEATSLAAGLARAVEDLSTRREPLSELAPNVDCR